MSKVEELLAKYNPNGVFQSDLREVSSIIRGKRVTKRDVKERGDYPVISGGESPMGYYDTFNREANTITIAQYGAAGYVDFQKNKFWANDVCYSILPFESVDNKYLYYTLKSKQNFIYSIRNTDAVPFSLPINTLYSIQIPLPHIKVQEEIVKILDSFTNLIDALNEELSLRQKQFECYREKLLTFDDNVNWDLFDNIGEITDYVANGSFADLKKNVKYLQESNYAILVRTLDLSSNFKNNNFVYIDKNAYDFLEKSKLFGGEIIINNVGAGVGTVFCCPKLERKMSLGPNSVVLKTDNNKFYYYWLSSKQGQDKIFQITSFSALPKFNKTSFKQILFPVIDEKIDADYIVEKLDAFESLISSLKEEIALRQKQYEYYREKLLTFD